MKRKRKWILLTAVVLLLVLLISLGIWGNTALQVTEISVQSDKIPQSFSGYRIAQISDLHNATFGKNNHRLVTQLQNTRPDVIVLTGDLVDRNRTNLEVAAAFVAKASEIAPTYYVTGNHEAIIAEYSQLEEMLLAAGVTVLHNQSVALTKGEDAIQMIGLQDPGFVATDEILELIPQKITEILTPLAEESDDYTVLLAHRPEYIDAYAAAKIDLVLSGHTHGGQIRLPFIGGVVAPAQGFWPEYDAGLYSVDQTQLVISRGLGNSLFPFRINNPPEIVVVTLVP